MSPLNNSELQDGEEFDLEEAVLAILDAHGVQEVPARTANVDRRRARLIVETDDLR